MRVKSILNFMLCGVLLSACGGKSDQIANNTLEYTTVSGSAIELKDSIFDTKVVSNEYVEGRGVITFEKELEFIDNKAFLDNADLLSVNFPGTLKLIGDSAFAGCKSLKEVKFAAESQLTTLGTVAFGYTALDSINFPESIKQFEDRLLMGCKNLKKITGKFSNVAQNAMVYEGRLLAVALNGISEYEVEEGITNIVRGTFADQDIAVVRMPESLERIGQHAFEGCNNLKEVHFTSQRAPFMSKSSFNFDNGLKLYIPGKYDYSKISDWAQVIKDEEKVLKY